MNNKNNLNKNLENNSLAKLDWTLVQSEMKNKLGNDIYESLTECLNQIFLERGVMYFEVDA